MKQTGDQKEKTLKAIVPLLSVFVVPAFVVPSHFTKKKEVFMSLSDHSWKPSVGIA